MATTQKIDVGLQRYFRDFDVVIVNSDSDSRDGTKKNFLGTDTKSKKHLLTSRVGKGNSLINFFRYCGKERVNYAATIDCDIKTLNPRWVKTLLEPLIRGEADYVTPLYARSRFEGSTTNNFAFPLIYSLFGRNIRQPIGGDFAFNKEYIGYILRQPFGGSTRQYGIDIFMTIHAVGGKFRLAEVFLGKKLHKPSFTKIGFMPRQVFESAFNTLKFYECSNRSNPEILGGKTCIIGGGGFSHEAEAKKLLTESLRMIKIKGRGYRNIVPGWKELKRKILGEGALGYKEWAVILGSFIAKGGENPKYLSELLVPLSLIRTTTFWLSSKSLSPSKAEREIIDQARETRRQFVTGRKENNHALCDERGT